MNTLPEKWSILRTKENYKKVNHYFNKLLNNGMDHYFYDTQVRFYYPKESGQAYQKPDSESSYVKISTEDFERLVLKPINNNLNTTNNDLQGKTFEGQRNDGTRSLGLQRITGKITSSKRLVGNKARIKPIKGKIRSSKIINKLLHC